MSLAITDLKKGTIFDFGGDPFKVVDYRQKVMGRGGSIVNVRIKNLIDGKVLDKTFKGGEQLEEAVITAQPAQYLYASGNTFYFMNQETFEQFEVSSDVIGDSSGFIKEGDMVKLEFFRGKVINLSLPKNVNLKVSYTEAAVKGDTSTAISKNATLETGLILKVPAFIKQGDVVSVDTGSGNYRERIKV